jgi:hypothetical protein
MGKAEHLAFEHLHDMMARATAVKALVVRDTVGCIWWNHPSTTDAVWAKRLFKHCGGSDDEWRPSVATFLYELNQERRRAGLDVGKKRKAGPDVTETS